MTTIPQLISPYNGEQLQAKSQFLLSDGELSWPVIDDVFYLRQNHKLREEAVFYLKKEDPDAALTVLLKDQDGFAPLPPPEDEALRPIINGKSGFLESMQLLNYGPVAEYFAHRASAPTFLSGLALLELAAHKKQPLIEIACGAGHFLRSLEANGFITTGIDLVFSKLWLARQFMNVKGTLICADIAAPPVIQSQQATSVFCHDAFYFFKEKQIVLDNLRSIAHGGSVILGHIHTNAIDHGVSGHPVSEVAYRKMASENARFYSDPDLVDFWLKSGETRSINQLQAGNNPVISWIENNTVDEALSLTTYADKLHLNQLLKERGSRLEIQWPTEGYRNEYEQEMPYFNTQALEKISTNELKTASGEAQSRYFKQRFLLDTPPL